MTRNSFRRAAPFLLFFLMPGLAAAAANLPEKAFRVEGGTVSASAGVMPNPEAPAALPIGKLKYPTRYFVRLTNDSPYPLWLDATWTFPQKNKEKAAKPGTVRSDKIPPGGSYWFYSDKLGVLVDEAIAVEIHAYSDAKRSNLIGNQKADLYFEQPSVDRFLANFPRPFQTRSGQAVVISGWNDIPSPRTDVPGSQADEVLQEDIQLSIWKADSMRQWSCEREVLSAATMAVEASQILSRLPEDAQQRARLEQAENKLSAEKWAVRSCGQEISYEVLLSASRAGGTDVMVVDVTDNLIPDSDTSESGADDVEEAATVPLSHPELNSETSPTANEPADETS